MAVPSLSPRHDEAGAARGAARCTQDFPVEPHHARTGHDGTVAARPIEAVAEHRPGRWRLSSCRQRDRSAGRRIRYGKTAFPAFSSDPGDQVFRFRLGPPIAVGPHGIPQPCPMDPEVMPDLVLVPLIAVDPRGYRIGQGGGHYDRALAALKERGSRFIGLGWPLQRLAFDLPEEPWDIPLDGFASPAGLEMFA